MNPLPKYNEKGELDTRLRVDPVTGDVGIGTPQRIWVGLTDEERIDIAYDAKRDEVVAVKLTEAKLRSKNR